MAYKRVPPEDGDAMSQIHQKLQLLMEGVCTKADQIHLDLR